MRFWWVNNKQTHEAEIDGGYIWSPKENKNGAKNETYLNLPKTKVGDIVFAYARGAIRAVGVCTGPCREQGKPSEFGSAGNAWEHAGWAVPIEWEVAPMPFEPKLHLADIIPLLPTKNSPIQLSGNGNQGCYLAALSNELGLLILKRLAETNSGLSGVLREHQSEAKNNEALLSLAQLSMESTEKEQLVKARLGQGKFRHNVERIERGCRVTGVTEKSVLVASHIKPWSESNNAERLDGHNGFLLAPHIDRLFDRGMITFSNDGNLVCARPIVEAILAKWGIALPINVGSFSDQQQAYLAYHQSHIFDPCS